MSADSISSEAIVESPAPGPSGIQISGLSKTFNGITVLDSVDLKIGGGEVRALVGQNGSGKSTLIKILAGFHKPNPGASVWVDRREVELGDSGSAREAGFRFVHQDLAVVGDLSAVENFALGREFKTGFAKRIRWRAERAEAERMLASIGFQMDVRAPLRELAPAERTAVAIARALQESADPPHLLVLDEPTASLSGREVEKLFHAVHLPEVSRSFMCLTGSTRCSPSPIASPSSEMARRSRPSM